MLTCVYSPVEPMRVVEEHEASGLKATGVWFDCPSKAQKYREKVEAEVLNEQKPPAKQNGRRK